ncbi:MAG TPA: hypothetical protein VME46_11355, partial [Acidimicrobiales bacterium]|nr:hypothetical protein [Acidimicrobiales bacterium]
LEVQGRAHCRDAAAQQLLGDRLLLGGQAFEHGVAVVVARSYAARAGPSAVASTAVVVALSSAGSLSPVALHAALAVAISAARPLAHTPSTGGPAYPSSWARRPAGRQVARFTRPRATPWSTRREARRGAGGAASALTIVAIAGSSCPSGRARGRGTRDVALVTSLAPVSGGSSGLASRAGRPVAPVAPVLALQARASTRAPIAAGTARTARAARSPAVAAAVRTCMFGAAPVRAGALPT